MPLSDLLGQFSQDQARNNTFNPEEAVKTGVGILQAQQQLDMNKQVLEMNKQKMDDAYDEKEAKMMETGFNKKFSPKVRSIMFEKINEMRQQRNKPLFDDAAIKAVLSDEGMSDNHLAIIKQINDYADAGDKQNYAQTRYKLERSLSDPQEAAALKLSLEPAQKKIESFSELGLTNQKAQVNAITKLKENGALGAPGIKGNPKMENLLSLPSDTIAAIISNPANPQNEDMKRALTLGQAYTSQLAAGKTESTISTNKARVENYATMAEYRQKSLDLRKGNQDMMRSRLSLQQSKFFNSTVNDVERITKDFETQKFAVAKGLSMLSNKDMNWANFNETNTDLAGLMSVRPSAVIPVAREAGIQYKGIDKDIAFVQSYLSGKFEGTPDEGLKQQLKDAFVRIDDVVTKVNDYRVAKRLNPMAKSGSLPREAVDSIWNDYSYSGGAMPSTKESRAAVSGAGEKKPYEGKGFTDPGFDKSVTYPEKAVMQQLGTDTAKNRLYIQYLKSLGYKFN